MESSHQKSGLVGAFLVLLLLGLTGWTAWLQYQPGPLRTLANKADESLYLVILTQPAMTVAYNPHAHKASLTALNRRNIPKDIVENAQDMFKQAGLKPNPLRYYQPLEVKREAFWEQVKINLVDWRKKPFIVAQVLWDYLKAYREKRTNIPPSEFLLYAMDLTRLEVTDFTVKNVEENKKKGKTKQAADSSTVETDTILPPVEDKAPLALDDRPLVIEILNASGRKGAALELTQYLREQAQRGFLNVDVLQYDNFPGERQKETHIIDLSGRQILLKQLSTAIGVNNEIISQKQDTAICDARIIIGEDFRQPS